VTNRQRASSQGAHPRRQSRARGQVRRAMPVRLGAERHGGWQSLRAQGDGKRDHRINPRNRKQQARQANAVMRSV